MSSKTKEGEKELSEGLSKLKTGLFRWSADHLSAVGCFDRAARAFKAARNTPKLLEALQLSSKSHYKLGNIKAAAAKLEDAARETKSEPAASVGFFRQAAALAQEAGDVQRAAELHFKAAQAVEPTNPEESMTLFQTACDLYKDSGKDHYAVNTYRATMSTFVKHKQFPKAMGIMDDMVALFGRLNQNHNIHQIVLSKIILAHHCGDEVAARRIFNESINIADFLSSKECEAAEDLARVMASGDPDDITAVTKTGPFNFLDRQVTMLARGLASHDGAPVKGGSGYKPKPGAAPTSLSAFLSAPDADATGSAGGAAGSAPDPDRDALLAKAADSRAKADRQALFGRGSAAPAPAQPALVAAPAPSPTPASAPVAAAAVGASAAALAAEADEFAVGASSSPAPAPVGASDTGAVVCASSASVEDDDEFAIGDSVAEVAADVTGAEAADTSAEAEASPSEATATATTVPPPPLPPVAPVVPAVLAEEDLPDLDFLK